MAEVVILTSPVQATRVDGDTAALVFRSSALDPDAPPVVASIAEHLRVLGWSGAVIALTGDWDYTTLDVDEMTGLGWMRIPHGETWRDHAKSVDCFCASSPDPCRFHEGFSAGLEAQH